MQIEIQKPHSYSITMIGMIKINNVFGLIKSAGLISVDRILQETKLSHFEVVDFALGYLLHSGHIAQYSEGFAVIKDDVKISINV